MHTPSPPATDRPASNARRNARAAKPRQRDNGVLTSAVRGQQRLRNKCHGCFVLTVCWFCSTVEQGPIQALSAVLHQSFNSFCTFSCRTGGQLRGYVLFCVRTWPNFPRTEDVPSRTNTMKPWYLKHNYSCCKTNTVLRLPNQEEIA